MMMVVADIAQWCCASSGGRGIQAAASNTPCDSMYIPDMVDFERTHKRTHTHTHTHTHAISQVHDSRDIGMHLVQTTHAPSTLSTNTAQCASKAPSNVASWTW